MKLKIQWLTVIAIALVQGSISVAWIVYRLYLPQLFTQWGLLEGLAATIIIIEGFLGILIEPLFGSLSDRQQRWLGTRFPLISLGVILASAFFLAIPTIVIFGQPQLLGKWLLPAIAIAWALAMTMFRSPVVALLAMSAPLAQIPLAISLSTAITGLIGAFRPIINKSILNLGEIFAFSLASFVILGSVAFLRQFQPIKSPQPEQNRPESILDKDIKFTGEDRQEARGNRQQRTVKGEDRQEARGNRQQRTVKNSSYDLVKSIFKDLNWSKIELIITLALGMAWGSRLLMGNVTKAVNNPNGMIIIGIIVAIAALPIGFLTLKIGNTSAMLKGTIGAIIMVFLLNIALNPISLALALIILPFALNFLLNGTLPLIMTLMPSHQIGLGIGVYFGSFTAAMSLFDLLFKPDQMTTTISLVFGIVSWILVASSIQLSSKKTLVS
jgi:hypothetical protein